MERRMSCPSLGAEQDHCIVDDPNDLSVVWTRDTTETNAMNVLLTNYIYAYKNM